MRLSRQFEKALVYATRIHGGKLRKKTRIPYIAHILGVTAIAMEYGANETEAIAALLHDAVEDCGGAKRLRDIERKFGKKVARIVEGCTDTDSRYAAAPEPAARATSTTKTAESAATTQAAARISTETIRYRPLIDL